MATTARPLAVITGASTGIGYELAKRCAKGGFDLLVAADEPRIAQAAGDFAAFGVNVDHVLTDLSDDDGVETLYRAIGGRPVEALLANAGIGLGDAFFDQSPDDFLKVVDTNICGTLVVIHRIGREMVARGRGRIMITGSIAGRIPGAFSAVYNGTKAFLDSFAIALRNELENTGVTVTCLMPGATETRFFERAGMTDTKVGQGKKDDPADVAEAGFNAMMKGEASVVTGFQNKVQAAAASVLPDETLAEMHRGKAQPGSR